jgi:hypothetical protein
MKRIVLFASLLASASAAGCMVERHGEGGWGPADEHRDPPGTPPPPSGGSEGRACERDQQCDWGCYCGRTDRRCHPSGACSRDSDCLNGMRCDERRSCVPRDHLPDAAPPSMNVPDAGAPADAATPDASPPKPDAARPPATVCRIDAQCGPGGRCVAATCQRPCTTGAACGTGDACKDGFCQPSPVSGGQCLYRADCPGGSPCINGFCHPMTAPTTPTPAGTASAALTCASFPSAPPTPTARPDGCASTPSAVRRA